jgi:hypothetical protein
MERFILNPIPASEVEEFKKQLSWEGYARTINSGKLL